MLEKRINGTSTFAKAFLVAVTILAANVALIADDVAKSGSDSVICGCAIVEADSAFGEATVILVPIGANANRPLQNLIVHLLINSDLFHFQGLTPAPGSAARQFSITHEAVDLEGGLQMIIVGLSDTSWRELGTEEKTYGIELQLRLEALTSEHDPRAGIPRGIVSGAPCVYAMVLYELNATEPELQNCNSPIGSMGDSPQSAGRR